VMLKNELWIKHKYLLLITAYSKLWWEKIE